MSEKSTLTPGQRLWLRDGRRAEFIAETDHGIVVRFGFHRPGSAYDSEDEYYDGLDMVSEVFIEPPVEATEARIAELLAKEIEAREALHTAQKAVRDAERDIKERLQKLAKHPPLEMLEALIENRITHFAVKSQYGTLAEIETFEEATTWVDTEFRRNRKELRMLALVGTGDRLQWMINTYGDGSGNWKSTVYPCLSYEEAWKKVAEICQAVAETLPRKGVDSRHIHVVDNAKKYGIDIPDWITAAVTQLRTDAAQAAIDQAAAALAAARAKAGIPAEAN